MFYIFYAKMLDFQKFFLIVLQNVHNAYIGLFYTITDLRSQF
jgi:hypothetical protein